MDAEAFRRWLLVQRALKPVTVRRMMQRLQFAVLNGLNLDGFPESADAYLASRIERGASPYAYNNDLKVLKALAQHEGIRLEAEFHKEPRPDPKALSDDDLARVFAYSHPVPAVNRLRRAVLCLEFLLGLRISELARLDVSDLDRRDSRVHVRFPAKGGMRRWLPVPRWVWSVRRPLGAYLRHRVQPPGDTDALWVTPAGMRGVSGSRRFTVDGLRRVVWESSQELGLAFNCNVARHTVASRLVREGFDVLYVRFFLGHASIQSTQIYAEVSARDVAELYRRKPPRDPYGGSA